MFNELSKPTEISIKDKKKVIKGKVVRAAIFARSKVINVLTADNEQYYFIYYKNSLIYGEKLETLKEGSFICKAFKDGITIDSPHPLLTALLPHLTLSIPNKNKIFAHLHNDYSLCEMAYIATSLDSFFEKDQLIQSIEKAFSHYRRSGEFYKSYQMARLLADFSPSLQSAKDRLNALEFNSYHNLYNPPYLPSLHKKDPLFVEVHCFKNRFKPDERMFLEDILTEQDRLVMLLLWLENAKNLRNLNSIKKITDIALQFITMEEWILLLGQVNINPYRELPDAKLVVDKMVKKGNYRSAALLLISFIEDLPPSYDEILKVIWENLDSTFIATNLDHFIKLIQKLPGSNQPELVEQRISDLASNLLKEYDLKTVQEKLSPVQTLHPDSTVIRKINEMFKLVEDPDRMMELGDLYSEFNQYDKAIDCFFWEMELEPQDPLPVRKISKMYQNKGLLSEAATYQKIYTQLKSNQETG
jgi:tetratricopeptide (TPR) repeat protein